MRSLLTMSALFFMTLAVVVAAYANAATAPVTLMADAPSKEVRSNPGRALLAEEIKSKLTDLGCRATSVSPATCNSTDQTCEFKVSTENCTFLNRKGAGCPPGDITNGLPPPLSNDLKACVAAKKSTATRSPPIFQIGVPRTTKPTGGAK